MGPQPQEQGYEASDDDIPLQVFLDNNTWETARWFRNGEVYLYGCHELIPFDIDSDMPMPHYP